MNCRIVLAISTVCLILALGTGCRTRDTAGASNASTTPVAQRVVGGLEEPVALVFLSPQLMLVAERRAGRIRWIENGQLRAEPFATLPVPEIDGSHEYGLLSLAVDPNYPDEPYVYAFHTVPSGGGTPTAQRVTRLTVRESRGVDPKTIVDNLPAGNSCCHNGGRILFGADGKLYITIGDGQQQEAAQDYEDQRGKVLRYNIDGTIPEDNPFEERLTGEIQEKPSTPDGATKTLSGRRTSVYTIGHRNAFGIALHPETNDLYITENGPERDDEINRVAIGDNYGWPEVMGKVDDSRYHAPVWATGNAVIAPTGAAFYTGTDFPGFRGNLFFAAYNDGKLRRVIFSDPDTVEAVEVVQPAGTNARLDVAMGPDGLLYYTNDTAVYRLVRRGSDTGTGNHR